MSAGQGYLILDENVFKYFISYELSRMFLMIIIMHEFFFELKFVKQDFVCECNSFFCNCKIYFMMSNGGSVSVEKFHREYSVKLFHEKSNYGKYTI